jgi:diguanylate cyclase (GGDEF)-like protein
VRNRSGRIVGAVELFSDSSSRAAMVARIEELEKLVLLDTLTRLANRRYVEMGLETRMQELKRFGWPVGFLFFDLDRFKAVNDRYGHETGDEVLKMIAETLVKHSRPFDLFGRWAGDEMVGIVRNVDEELLRRIGQRLLLMVEHSYVCRGSTRVHVTLSMGCTLLRPEDTIETLVQRADQLMYRSKREGGNRLTLG